MTTAQQVLLKVCKDGTEADARLLLGRPDIEINYEDENLLTPLQHCLFHSNMLVAKLLIEAGASIHHKAKGGVTPLHTAALGGSVDCVMLCIRSGANVNEITAEGLTALHYAVDGRAEVARVLIDNGANVNMPTKNAGYTPLHKAAFAGQADAIAVLVEANASLEAVNLNGNTALHVACREGHTASCAVLVEHGASLQAKNKNGKTPRHLAEEGRHLPTISWLDSLSAEHGPLELVYAIEDCAGGGIDNHLAFNEGDIITVLRKPYDDWWIGRVGQGPEGLFCTLLVDTRPLDPREGSLTGSLTVEYEAANSRAIADVNRLVGQAASISMSAGRTALIEIGSQPLLAEKADTLAKVPEFSDDTKKKYAALKALLAEKDKGPAAAAATVESAGSELVHAAVQAHEQQNAVLRRRIHDLEVSGEISPEQKEQLHAKLTENSTKMVEWKTLMSTSPQACVFCYRLYNKLAEVFVGVKACKAAILAKSHDYWAKSSCCVRLLDEPIPLPGFSLLLDSQTSLLLSRGRIVAQIKAISALVPYISSIDEVSIGTALAVVHAYINQIKQLTVVGAALLADGAVMQILEYLINDCPEYSGSMITIEALSRSMVFARRGNDVARWMKAQTVQLQSPDPNHQWSLNGVFRETGVRTPDGKKHRGCDTRTDIYGYRHGSYLEAKELCMAPAGEEHTLGPRRGRMQHSAVTTSLFRRPSHAERDSQAKKRGVAGRASAKRASLSKMLTSSSGSDDSPQTLPKVNARLGSDRGTRSLPSGGRSSPSRVSPLVDSKPANGPTNKVALQGLTGTVEQLRLGSELNQAQLKSMFDRMCELSAQVDALKSRVPSEDT